MVDPLVDRHLIRLRARDRVSAEEEAAILDAIVEFRDHPADRTIIHAGEELHHSTILLDGLMCRYKDLPDGQRQITEIHVPGDFADLHSFSLKRLDHNLLTLTPCRIAVVPHSKLKAITERFPHLTRVYWFSTNLDAAIHREWELSLGRRTAIARTAALFCELHIRLEIVGMVDGFSYTLPLTQTELAECLGLTSIHVNRTLKELRERGLVTFKSGHVNITDIEGLRQVADFDPSYLYLEQRDR